MRMISRAREIAVQTIMESHIYQLDGKVFQQKDGGHIGLEITDVLAQLVMLWWEKLKVLGFELEF